MPRSTVTLLVVVLLAATLATPAAGAPNAGGTTGADAMSAARGCAGGSAAVPAEGDGANVSIDTLVAPGFAYDRLRNASAMAAAMDQGLVVPAAMDPLADHSTSAVVASEDVAVHRIQLSGQATRLLDRLAAGDRGSPTANFRALAEEDGIEFRYWGPGMCPPHLVLNETVEPGAFRVVPDDRNDTLYLLVDVDEAVYELGERSDERWTFGYHRMEFGLAPESGLVSETVDARDDYEVVHPAATVTGSDDRPGLLLEAAPERIVGGETTVAAGRALTVELAFENGTTVTRTAQVHAHHEESDSPGHYHGEGNSSRHYHAAFDLSDVPEGTEFEVTVRDGDRALDATGGEVVDRLPSVALPAREQWDDETIVVDEVTLPHGGFVRVAATSGYTLGTTEYLAPGTYRDLAVEVDTDALDWLADSVTSTTVAHVHFDANDDREFDRWEDPSYVTDGNEVNAEAPIASPTPTATPSPTATPTPTEPSSPTSSPTPTATPTTTPGFGMGAALLALATASVAAGRRRR